MKVIFIFLPFFFFLSFLSFIDWIFFYNIYDLTYFLYSESCDFLHWILADFEYLFWWLFSINIFLFLYYAIYSIKCVTRVRRRYYFLDLNFLLLKFHYLFLFIVISVLCFFNYKIRLYLRFKPVINIMSDLSLYNTFDFISLFVLLVILLILVLILIAFFKYLSKFSYIFKGDN